MKNLKIKILTPIFLFIFLTLPNFAKADWQSTLQTNFDHVETFDNLPDWRGVVYDGVSGQHSSGMPNGSLMLKAYEYYGTNASGNWIQNFGSGTNITGKSIILDMNDTYGPDRLHFYFGDGTTSHGSGNDATGYDNISNFYRVKFLPGLFISPTQAAQGYSWAYFKWWELGQGFVAATEWGSAQDRAAVFSGYKACVNDHTYHAYGPNFTLLNLGYAGNLKNAFKMGGLEIGSVATCNTPLINGSTDAVGIQMYNWISPNDHIYDNDTFESTDNGTFDLYNYQDRWLGFEVRASLGPDSGDSVHSRYGDLEYWIYDETGNVLRHWNVLTNGYITSFHSNIAGDRVPNQTYYSNQKYNKVTVGGNIKLYINGIDTGGGNTSGMSYIDDMIVSGSRIGPAYYALLNGQPVNGTCGSANGGSFSTLTSASSNLCSQGAVASFAFNSGTNRWTWGCNGMGGGTNTGSTACSALNLPPVVSNGSPSGTLNYGTTSATLSVTTDENATCKYSTAPNTAYSFMTSTFTTTGSTFHSSTISGLANGQSYNYYVRCQDTAGSPDTNDYTVSSSVSNNTTVNIGETNILATDDSGNQNILSAQQATLSQAATIKTISLYAPSVSGKLRLGVYDAQGAGGTPKNLVAYTNEITPTAGWNTVPLLAVGSATLQAGTYWLAYLPDNNGLHFRKSTGGIYYAYNYTYGTLPSVFNMSSPSIGTENVHWSIYATLDVSSTYTITDLINLILSWLHIGSGNGSDLNSDGYVNPKDLGIMMSKWN